MSQQTSESTASTLAQRRGVWWPWISAGLGLIIMVVTYASDAILYRWLEARNLEQQYSNPLDWVLGLIGLLLLVGGIVSGLLQRHRS